jgi:hypothetical protein
MPVAAGDSPTVESLKINLEKQDVERSRLSRKLWLDATKLITVQRS